MEGPAGGVLIVLGPWVGNAGSAGPRAGCWTVLVLALGLACGCRTHDERLATFRAAYAHADFVAAERAIDDLLARASGLPEEAIASAITGAGIAAELDPARGDLLLILLEKAMVRLALGDPDGALAILRSCRDELDRRMVRSVSVFAERLGATLTDDRALSYAGADYEHLVVRMMLALADLVAGGGDAYAYAVQIGEKQEEIIGSPFGSVETEGEVQGYRPRERYRRIAAGAYLQGVLREATLQLDEACRAYRRALEYLPDSPLLEAAVARACEGQPVAPGHGVVHVLHLSGQGPYLETGTAVVTDQALLLAGLLMLLLAEDPGVLFQAPVPVPVLVPGHGRSGALGVTAGGTEAMTEPLLDVRQVAQEQLAANLPWILARAVVRRTLKGAAATVVKRGVERETRSRGGGMLAGILVNLLTTATERADTRCWSSLPAQFRAARLELPAGNHVLEFSTGQSLEVRVAAGFLSVVLAIHVDGSQPAVLLLDPYSRVTSPAAAVP